MYLKSKEKTMKPSAKKEFDEIALESEKLLKKTLNETTASKPKPKEMDKTDGLFSRFQQTILLQKQKEKELLLKQQSQTQSTSSSNNINDSPANSNTKV